MGLCPDRRRVVSTTMAFRVRYGFMGDAYAFSAAAPKSNRKYKFTNRSSSNAEARYPGRGTGKSEGESK